MLDERHAGDSWPNKMDMGWEVLRERKSLKTRRGGGVTAGKKSLHLDLVMERGETGRQTRDEWDREGDKVRYTARQKEVIEDRRSRGELWEKQQKNRVVMVRVYQLFRCRLLIKHRQTLNLLTINTLLHHCAFSFSSLLLVLFPSGSLHLSLSLSFTAPSLPLSVSLSLYQTPATQARLTI